MQIREDQSRGQVVRRFRLTATQADGTKVALCPEKASSLGNKFICALRTPLTLAELSLSVTAAEGGTPRIAQFAAFRCGQLAAEIDAVWAASPHAV